MIENKEFKVGDRVVRNYTPGYSCVIGTITKITGKRKDIVVDYGDYQERYNLHGWQKGGEVWCTSYIEFLTPEIEKEIEETRTIKKCVDIFCRSNITYEQAVKILKILEDE